MCIGEIALLVISFVIFFVRSQNKHSISKRETHDANLAHQRELLRTIINSQEIERKRIGQDLHDEIGGSLSNLRILINSLDAANKKEYETHANTQLYKALIDKIILDVRNISHNLSPPALALFGFSEALQELKDIICGENESFITINNEAEEVIEKLSYPVALTLIRVLQELITNTLKHSGATQVIISLFMNDGLFTIQYLDNGIGYNPNDQKVKKGMGLQNIESRLNVINADYSLTTAEKQGFSMLIYLDLKIQQHQ